MTKYAKVFGRAKDQCEEAKHLKADRVAKEEAKRELRRARRRAEKRGGEPK
jgi:hypothetical protein